MNFFGQFPKGFTLDPVGHKYTSARRLIGTAIPSPNASVNQYSPPITDQGRKSSCVGHGLAGSWSTSCNAAGVLSSIVKAYSWQHPLPNPEWIYKIARAVDRDDPSIPLEDEGSMPNQAVRGIEEFGVVAYEECSSADEDVNTEPTVLQLIKASRVHAIGWNTINTIGKERVLDVMRAIDRKPGLAVPAASIVDTYFEDYNGAGIIPAIPKNDLGGHLYYFTEYQTNSAGRILFKFRNSWSELWGDKGCGWVDEEFIMNRLLFVCTASAQIKGALP